MRTPASKSVGLFRPRVHRSIARFPTKGVDHGFGGPLSVDDRPRRGEDMGGFRSVGIDRPGRMGRVARVWFAGWLAGVLGVIVVTGGLVRAQGPVRNASPFTPDSSDDAERSLRNAASHVREGQWSEAIDIYQRVIERYRDKVAKLPKTEAVGEVAGEFTLYVNDREFCHRCLARLPGEAQTDLPQPRQRSGRAVVSRGRGPS